MRAIDGDKLTEILTTAIKNMEGMAKFIGCEDDPEIKMEIKAYRDILNGVKEQPTIEPERKKGKWIDLWDRSRCSACNMDSTYEHNFCPNCGADMR